MPEVALTRADAAPAGNDRTKASFYDRFARLTECRRCPGTGAEHLTEGGSRTRITAAAAARPAASGTPRPASPPESRAATQAPGFIHRATLCFSPRPLPAGRPPASRYDPEKEVERIFNEHCKNCGGLTPRNKSAGAVVAGWPRTAWPFSTRSRWPPNTAPAKYG